MTAWPEPEREREPARPPRPPRPPRQPGDPRLRRPQDPWVWIGAGLSVVFLVVFFGYWTNWFGLTAPASNPDATAGSDVGEFHHTLVGDLALLAVLVLVLGGIGWWLLRALRSDAPDLDELPEVEQERRRKAGELLRDPNPPVSEEEAAAMLRPAWLEEASRRAAERSQGAGAPLAPPEHNGQHHDSGPTRS